MFMEVLTMLNTKQTDLKQYQITKSNKLIQKTRYSLTLQEQKILLYIIQKVKPADTDFETYTISIKEFCEISGINHSNGKNYMNVKKAILGLKNKAFWFELPDGSEVTMDWIAKAKISKEKSTIEVRLDEDLKPHLLELKEFFVSYRFYYVMAMKSQFSVRLYELLKSYGNLGNVTFKIETLKERLDLLPDKFAQWNDLKRYVIEKAIDEINLLTDLNVEYEPIKDGRTVTKVKFVMTEKSQAATQESEKQIEKRINPRRFKEVEEDLPEVPMFDWLNA